MAAPAGVDAPSSAVAAAPRAYLLDTSRAPGGSSIADMSESDQLAALDPLHRCFGDCVLDLRVSVTADAEEKVPTGGQLTLFEAVGRAGQDLLLFCRCRRS